MQVYVVPPDVSTQEIEGFIKILLFNLYPPWRYVAIYDVKEKLIYVIKKEKEKFNLYPCDRRFDARDLDQILYPLQV